MINQGIQVDGNVHFDQNLLEMQKFIANQREAEYTISPEMQKVIFLTVY